MKVITPEVEARIAEMITKEFISICALNKINFLELSQNMQLAIFDAFQYGVSFMEKGGKKFIHTHNYKKVGVMGIPDYFECECGDQTDESQAVEYYEAIQANLKEAQSTGN